MTSQIFANIYLNEFDRFVRTTIKPLAYLRYGDDFMLFLPDRQQAEQARLAGISFLRERLRLKLRARNDVIFRANQGARFLGVESFPNGRRLLPQIERKIADRISLKNFTAYSGLVRQHGSRQQQAKLMHLPDEFMV